MKSLILRLAPWFILIFWIKPVAHATTTIFPTDYHSTDVDIYLPFIIRVSEGANTVAFVDPFTVDPGPERIFLSWLSHAEIDVAGFLVRRSPVNFGNYDSWEVVPIIDLDNGAESTFIPGRGALGAAYNFYDANVEYGIRYYYILEIIYIDNSRAIVGAFSAIP